MWRAIGSGLWAAALVSVSVSMSWGQETYRQRIGNANGTTGESTVRLYELPANSKMPKSRFEELQEFAKTSSKNAAIAQTKIDRLQRDSELFRAQYDVELAKYEDPRYQAANTKDGVKNERLRFDYKGLKLWRDEIVAQQASIVAWKKYRDEQTQAAKLYEEQASNELVRSIQQYSLRSRQSQSNAATRSSSSLLDWQRSQFNAFSDFAWRGNGSQWQDHGPQSR